MKMTKGLLVNGPAEWYDNLSRQFQKHGGTWLAQDKPLRPEYLAEFKRLIKSRGYFTVLGYVQKTAKAVTYRFEVDDCKVSSSKIPVPDSSAPPFSSYDIEQGKCLPGDYAYQTWLHASALSVISPKGLSEFINLNNGRSIKSVRGQPHYYIGIPVELDGLDSYHQVKADLESLADEEEHFEGTQTKRFSNFYERDPSLRAKAILIHKTICKVCGFDFKAKYGLRGEGYIEVHHLKPVSELGGRTQVNPETDMTVLCANCHRMIHRWRSEILSPDQLSTILKKGDF